MTLVGSLHRLAEADRDSKEVSWGFVALSFGALAAGLELSALLYENGVPYFQIHLILALYSCINWYIFDRTKQGLILASICAIGAPLGELPILLWFKWWHYTRPDVFALLPSWVVWCYFFYTPSIGNLARKLQQQDRSSWFFSPEWTQALIHSFLHEDQIYWGLQYHSRLPSTIREADQSVSIYVSIWVKQQIWFFTCKEAIVQCFLSSKRLNNSVSKAPLSFLARLSLRSLSRCISAL